MAQLVISNVINISVSQTPAGLGQYNTSNLAMFTDDTPNNTFTGTYKIYLEPTEVGVDFGTTSNTYKMALAVFSQKPNILLPGGYLVIIPFLNSETLDDAITRTVGLVQYFGIISTKVETQTDMLAAAAVVQALNKMAFFVQTNSNSIDNGGSLDLLTDGGFTQSRGLYYSDATNALRMLAAYAGRALSTAFSGSNTTQNMHLKQLATIPADPGMTQTLLDKAQDAGADVYASIQGYSCVFSSGANEFFDAVYNRLWFAGALQIAYFNYLATTSTKIPQTENGMDGIKGAVRQVCIQAVGNQYLAPGVWNDPATFGNQEDLLSNVLQFGYYIYSTPIALQTQADREERKAPIIQIAAKTAGAINSGTIIVNVNA